MAIKVIFVISLLLLLFVSYFFIRRNMKTYRKDKLTMIDWMKMSNQDRYLSDINDRNQSLKRKKTLIGNIRQEYKKISSNSKSN